MNSILRIGFVGAGDIVRTRHIPNLQKLEGVELVSVCNSSQDSSERTAQAIGLHKVYADWRDLVRDNEIDIVWIGTWPYMHCPVTLAALEAGKHVFCQARMAMNVKEARAMLEAARKSDKVTMLCPPPMGMKGDRVMRQLLDEGTLGELYSIHFRDISPSCHNPDHPIHWRQRQELSGFNSMTVGIYAEVIHRWFGYARSVTAEAKTFIQHRSSMDSDSVPVTRPDVVMALSEMENGALLRWEWSSVALTDPISVLEVFGSRGGLCYDFRTDEIILTRDGKSWENVPITPENECQWTVERDFIAAIREGQEVHPDFQDGIQYMQLTEAIFRSVERGTRIALPLADG